MDQQQQSTASAASRKLRLEQAQALGFATIGEMLEHQQWLERKGTPEYMEWLAAQKQQRKPMAVRFFNIQWDTDGQKTDLPSEVTLEVPDSNMDIATEGADILSDKYGWCVKSFQFEEAPEVWSKEDAAAAQAHGWDLFQAVVDGKFVLLIERCDESGVFADDDKAVEFVRAQAASGDPVAAKALRLDHEISSRTPWHDWIGEVDRQFGEDGLSEEDKEAIHQNRSDLGCGAEEATEATQTVKMVVLCRNSEGAPEFHTCAVEVTPTQRASGDHYEMAEDNAVDNGYEPQFAFEENDPAAKQMGEIHAWL